jgi:predicted cupin superfamily sugar epimerase
MYISLPMNAEAEQLISKLGLLPLPGEGGYFAQTWTSSSVGPGGRAMGSAILFLITDTGFSALHRLGLEELWHFHAGDAVILTQIDPKAGSLRTFVLGPDVTGSQVPQVLVPAGIWQGARLAPAAASGHRGWALLGCTLTPAWDEKEFELGQRQALVRDFPAHAGAITELTR